MSQRNYFASKSTRGGSDFGRADATSWRPSSETDEWSIVGPTKKEVPKEKFHGTRPQVSDGKHRSHHSSGSHSTHSTTSGESGYDVKSSIKRWASGNRPCAEMLSFRKIGEWTASKFESDNRLTMIVELAKNLRHDVLLELITVNKTFSSNLPLKGYTPLQHVGYPSKLSAASATLADLQDTARVLVEEYGFRVFATCDEEVRAKESVYGALTARSNPLPSDIRLAFYKFLTEEAPIKWYLPNFNGHLNKLSNSNAARFHNKLLAVICRFPEEAANAVFNQLMAGRAPRVELLVRVKLIFETLMSAPNREDREMDTFFSKVDIAANIAQFASAFVVNGSSWVLEEASGLVEGSEEHSDRVSLNSRIYYAALGCIYAMGYARAEILDVLLHQLGQSSPPAWIARSVAMFLLHAEIKIDSTDPVQIDFIRVYISTCYVSSSLKDKMDIELGLSATYKQLSDFIAGSAVVKMVVVAKKDKDEPDWDAMMDAVGDEIADFD